MSDQPATTPLNNTLEIKSEAEIICEDIAAKRHLVIAKAVVEMGDLIKEKTSRSSIGGDSDFGDYLNASVRLLIGY